jgi:DNA-binding NarL/FixJ family response regulator
MLFGIVLSRFPCLKLVVEQYARYSGRLLRAKIGLTRVRDPDHTVNSPAFFLTLRPPRSKGSYMAVKPIRVLIIDDHTLIRAGITALLERMERIEVVGEAGDGSEGIRLIEELTPDVILLDLQLPGLSGFEVLEQTVAKFPAIKIIVLSVHDAEEYALRALLAGAAGYLPKSAASTELERAIDQVVRGEQYQPTTLAQTPSAESSSSARPQPPALELTPRQREVLTLIAEGYSTKKIARALSISVKTVETHRAQLMDRLDIHDVASLVRYAIKMKLVSLDERAPQKKMRGGA